MSVRDVRPRFEHIDANAPRFAARMTRGGRLGVLRLPFLEDAWGGLEAGQPELVVEATLSMLDNGIVVFLAYRDADIPDGLTPVEALRAFDAALGERAWRLASEAATTATEVEARFQRTAYFLEFDLGVMGAVPSWAGGVTEAEYLAYRNESVYPAILLAEAIGALDHFPVPATYLEAAHDARDAGLVELVRSDT
ncbi:MAG: hypothetical protein AB7P33_12355 [Dehalococcoidia bacterium]